MVCNGLDLRIESFAKGSHLPFWAVSCDKHQIVNAQISVCLQVAENKLAAPVAQLDRASAF